MKDRADIVIDAAKCALRSAKRRAARIQIFSLGAKMARLAGEPFFSSNVRASGRQRSRWSAHSAESLSCRRRSTHKRQDQTRFPADEEFHPCREPGWRRGSEQMDWKEPQ